MRKPVFTEKQIRQILRRYDGRSETITELVKKFRCARHNIRATAFANGYCTTRKRKSWSPREDAYIKENWGRISGDEMCAALGRTYNSINLRRKRLGAWSTRDRTDSYCIRDLEQLTGIDHRYWHDFESRGWLRIFNQFGRSEVTAVCVTTESIKALLNEHPEIYDYAHAPPTTRAAFELFSLKPAPPYKRVVCRSDSWVDGSKLTPTGFQVHHGEPRLVEKKHKYTLKSCAKLGGTGFWTAIYDMSPTCPRCGCKVSRFSEEGVFSFEDPGNVETLNHIAGKLALKFVDGKFVDAGGHRLDDADVMRYVFSTHRNPATAVTVFRKLLASGLRIIDDSPVRAEDQAPNLLGYELAPEQQRVFGEFTACGNIGIYWPPGSGKQYLGCYAMTTIRGPHRLFVHSDTIRDGWLEHLQRYAPFVTIQKRSKPTRCVVTVFESNSGAVRSTIEIWNYRTRYSFGDSPCQIACFDEAHFLPGNHAHKLAMLNSRYRIALSATPYRGDGREALLESMTGKSLGKEWGKTNAAGREIPRIPIKVMIVRDVEAKFAAIQQLTKRSGKTLIFSEGLADGKRIAYENGIPFVFSETKDRLPILRSNRVVCISRVGDCGLDIADLATCIEFSGLGGSRAQSLQRVGRLLHSRTARQHIVLMTAKELALFSRRLEVLEEKGFPLKIAMFRATKRGRRVAVAPSAIRQTAQSQWWQLLGGIGRPWATLSAAAA